MIPCPLRRSQHSRKKTLLVEEHEWINEINVIFNGMLHSNYLKKHHLELLLLP
jgi:hypothetical protein